MPNPLRSVALLCLAAATVAAPGCAKRLQSTLAPANQPPVIRLEGVAAPAGATGTLAARLRWTARDPDGRVDHYLVTTDLAGLARESAWSATTAAEQVLSFRRAERGAAQRSSPATSAFTFFAVEAVDDRGARSEAAYRAFFDEDIAPTVTITQPTPSPLITSTVPPDVWIRWAGSDPDGPNGRPVKYKYTLFRNSPGIPWSVWLADPDSLRRQFAPAFAGWDSVSGDSTAHRYTGLVPGSEYLFVITALDAEGAYDPVFSLSKNMLRFFVVPMGAAGPRLTLFNETFTYTYPAGGIPPVLDPSWVVHIQAAADQPVVVNWYGIPPAGSQMAGYRWALDIADAGDETQRSNPNDLAHWSRWDLARTSVTLNPAVLPPASGPRRLFVEAVDGNGLISLGVVEIAFVTPTFDRDLLVINDTRFPVDQTVSGHPDSLRPPTGTWPSAAELDTFLFAVGGVRWRMTPTGTLSAAGIFHGYSYDTLGTRNGQPDPTIPLDVLAHYRHVVWMTDAGGSGFTASPASLVSPMTTLRYMSQAGRQNSLASWVKAGGRLWALGGGFGNATNAPWNNTANDGSYRVYSSAGANPDLGPGRFMYDLAHWRSQFSVAPANPCIVQRSPFPVADPAGSSGFTLLPATLANKQPALDPLPPYRSAGAFYTNTMSVVLEYLSLPDTVIERVISGPKLSLRVQKLDTLMVASNSLLPPQGPNPAVDRIVNPVMTHYHGADCGPVVFTGFDIWSWTHRDCAALVDAVLQGYWHLTRNPTPVGPVALPDRAAAGR